MARSRGGIDYDYFYLATSAYYNNNNNNHGITITEILYCPAPQVASSPHPKQNGWVLGTSGGGVKCSYNRPR